MTIDNHGQEDVVYDSLLNSPIRPQTWHDMDMITATNCLRFFYVTTRLWINLMLKL